MAKISRSYGKLSVFEAFLIRGLKFVNVLYQNHIKGRWFSAFLLPIRHFLAFLFYYLNRRDEIVKEKKYGIDTAGIQYIIDTSHAQDAGYYEPTPYSRLESLLSKLVLTPDDVFIDIGCGKGRVVCCMATRPIRKVIGIEMIPDLADIAKQNAITHPNQTPIEIIQGDAASIDMSEGTIYYMYNPFGKQTMSHVLANIYHSLQTNPRPIRIVYVYPRHASSIDAQQWLEREEEEIGLYCIWRSCYNSSKEKMVIGEQGKGIAGSVGR